MATIVILLLPPTKRVKELPQRTQLKGGITPGGNWYPSGCRGYWISKTNLSPHWLRCTNLSRLRSWNWKLQRLYLSLESSSSQLNPTPITVTHFHWSILKLSFHPSLCLSRRFQATIWHTLNVGLHVVTVVSDYVTVFAILMDRRLTPTVQRKVLSHWLTMETARQRYVGACHVEPSVLRTRLARALGIK